MDGVSMTYSNFIYVYKKYVLYNINKFQLKNIIVIMNVEIFHQL